MIKHIKSLNIESTTEYFAKKRIIQEAFRFFINDITNTEQIHIISEYTEDNGGKFSKRINRDKLIELLGYDFTKQPNKLYDDPNLRYKDDILNFYNKL